MSPSREELFRQFISSFGVDVNGEHFKETPKRVSKMYAEILAGYSKPTFSFTTFKAPPEPSLVVVDNIDYHSLCSHHMMPFFGRAHIAYLPGEKICGLSKLARVTRHFAQKLQVQEILTNEIADYLNEKLEAKAVAVVLTGRHMCMEMRGVRSSCANTTTSAMRGYFLTDQSLKEEFFEILRLPRA